LDKVQKMVDQMERHLEAFRKMERQGDISRDELEGYERGFAQFMESVPAMRARIGELGWDGEDDAVVAVKPKRVLGRLILVTRLKGKTQAKLARAAGLSDGMYSLILRGKTREFTIMEQVAIARECGFFDLEGAAWLFANWEPGPGSRDLFTEEEIKGMGGEAIG
jgi:hypothetical protein